MIKDLEPVAKEKAINLQVHNMTDVPVRADRLKLEQVLRNLIDNALKFTSEGQVVVQSEIREPERMIITVTDTGCGIPPDHHQKGL